MKSFNGSDKIGYTDILNIVFGDKYIKKYLENEECLNYTFDEVLQCAVENGYQKRDGTILVIAENPLSGKVYRYGNYGDFWTEIGTTVGYA